MKKSKDLWNQCIEIWKTPTAHYSTKKNLQNDAKIIFSFALGMVVIEIIHPVESLENLMWGIGIVGFCIFMATITLHILDWLVFHWTKQPLFKTFGRKFIAFFLVYNLIFAYLFVLRLISFSLNIRLFYGEWSWVLYWRTLPFGFLIYLLHSMHEYKKTSYERSIQQFNSKFSRKKISEDPQITFHDTLICFPLEIGSIEISPQNITHITVEEHYLHINHLVQDVVKEIVIRKPLKTMHEELPYPLFQRIHRSHLVNIKHISQIQKEKGLYFSFIYHNQFKLPIGRSYLSQTLNSIQTLL
jgi:hypothetical protein